MGRPAVHAFLLFGALVTGLYAGSMPFGRGLWVVRHTLNGQAAVRVMVDRAAGAGFNTIFIQVRGRGDAWYRHGTEPAAGPYVREGTDPLDTLIALAHDRGLQVHAWLNVMLVGGRTGPHPDPDHILNRNPEWAAFDRKGKTVLEYSRAEFDACKMEGSFVSPGIPEARSHFAAVVETLLSHYALDGIHLDYLRYPGGEFGFNPAVLTRFREGAGFDPREMDPDERQEKEKWLSWRCSRVTDWLADVRAVIGRKRPSAALSVAVKADYGNARERFGQDWAEWSRRGLADIIVPMMYDVGTERFRDRLRESIRLVRDRHLYIGIAGYNQPPFSTVHKVLQACLREGVDGVALFSYTAMAEEPRYFSLLERGPFREPAAVPPLTFGENRIPPLPAADK